MGALRGTSPNLDSDVSQPSVFVEEPALQAGVPRHSRPGFSPGGIASMSSMLLMNSAWSFAATLVPTKMARWPTLGSMV